ncbi:hypothetical protein GJ496_000080 [Pomphorhynchus laevis]|nr:hypothetical protein GJ496_000080 [Pomphorhynchus laevis]
MSPPHSTFVQNYPKVGNIALLPIKSHFNGPAPKITDNSQIDIIDEALTFFKAMIFFRSYDIQSNADRTLIYLVLYISECLRQLQKCPNKNKSSKEMFAFGLKRFPLPGDLNFTMNAIFTAPQTKEECDLLTQYIQQLQQETSYRLCDKVFEDSEDDKPSKWWICFAKRKFMGCSL